MSRLHDLNDMATFAKVVQSGGFTAAAENLGLPKSNVSRRVSRLEAELGVRLLERTTRRLRLTEIGEIYFQHCQRILEEADFAELSINQMMESPRGLLRVSASVSIGQQMIAPALANFLRQYPEVQLQLTLSNRRIDLIEEAFDVAIRVGKLDDSRLVARRLGTTSMRLYASNQYLKQHGVPSHPRELNQHSLFLMSENSEHKELRLNGPEGKGKYLVKPRAWINDFETLDKLVTADIGIALLPHNRTMDKPLINVLPEWSADSVEFHALYPSARGATPKLRAFLDFITQTFEQALNER